ncbi:MAG TPA: copper resistance CopC family protein [Propionibacteriaceae bacterium]|nr:copper resistance CopC family protein [Propionibacteriaceae bacterium]
MTHSGRRRLATLLVAVMGLWLMALPAVAHDDLASSSPQDAQQLERVPATVVLTFNEPALALGTQVVITGPSGPVQQGAASVVDDTVTQPLRSDAPAGDYNVSWRVTAVDGHPVSGSFTFSARQAGTGSPPGSVAVPAPQASSSGSSAAWVWLVVGVLLAGTMVSVLRFRSRRQRAATSES